MGSNNLVYTTHSPMKDTRKWTSCLKPDEIEQWFKMVPKLRKPGMLLDDARDIAQARILNRRK